MSEETHAHAQHATKFTPTMMWQIATIVVAAVLVASVLTHGFSFTGAFTSNTLTSSQASTKAVSFINNMLDGQATASLVSINESNGLYNMMLDIGGQQYNTFMTKDGSLLFPSAYDLTVVLNTTTTTGNTSNQTQTGYPKTDKPKVEFFVMSFCPYGQQAETGLKGAYDVLGDTVEWQPRFVIYSDYATADYCLDANQTYCSMHGRAELNEDVRQMCIWKYYNSSTWWNYVDGINSACSSTNVETCWLNVANATGIDTAKISACQADEAVTLLEAEVQLNKQLNVKGSPSVFVNGKSYSGARSPSAFQSAICSAFNTAQSACNQTVDSTEAATSGGCGG